MNDNKGLIVGCVLGASVERASDWSHWQLPILLQYCPAQQALADRFDRTEAMVRLEAAGFRPLALVASNLDGQPGLALVIGEMPPRVRRYVLEQEQQILAEALEFENMRGAS